MATAMEQGSARRTIRLIRTVRQARQYKPDAVPQDVLKHHLPKDRVALARREYRAGADPAFLTYGPKSRREFLNLQSWSRPPAR